MVWVISEGAILPTAIIKERNSARMLVDTHAPKAAFAGERVFQVAHTATKNTVGNPMKIIAKEKSMPC